MKQIKAIKAAMAIVAVLGPLLATSSTAAAVDMCFSDTCGSKVIVVKQYRKPSRGKCRTVAAYEASTPVPYPGTGTVCLNASGNKLYASFSIPYIQTEMWGWQWTLPYPSLTGGDVRANRIIAGGPTEHQLHVCLDGASAIPCAPAPIP